MKTVSSAPAHGITHGVSTKQDRGWTVYPRGDGAGFGISFRITKGIWRDRRIPRDEARTRPQAERWARANVERLRAGDPTVTTTAPAVVRVCDLEDRYLEIRGRMGLRPSTLKQDTSVMSAHVVPHLGKVAMVDLDVARLLDFVEVLQKEGKSPATIRNILSVVRNFLDIAKARKLAPIMSNPTRDPEFMKLGRPKRTRSPKVLVGIEVVEKLLTLPCEDVPEVWKLRILIGCTSGLRDGEIAGLQWNDIDLEAAVPVLHVLEAVALVGEKGKAAQRGPTKTIGSVRDVPIHPEAVKALKGWKTGGFVEWTGRHAQAHDFVLPNESGEAWRPHSARKLREFLTLAKCSATCAGKNVDFHALRRSFATWLARAGVERAVRQKLLGHGQGDDVGELHYVERDSTQLYEAICKIRIDLSRGKVISLPMRAVAQ